MNPPLVGVIGATGGVGRALTRRLLQHRDFGMRLGARCWATGPAELTGNGRARLMRVDIDDAPSLLEFCRGCSVVVNCSGPSFRFLDTVARAALSVGADYVDAAGDEPVHDRLSATPPHAPGSRCVLSAGMMPGLSGLLPRYLAETAEPSSNLVAYVAVLDHFSRAAAEDYLAGMTRSESLAAWRHGARSSRALVRLNDVPLPMFSEPVTAHPYLSPEAERVARSLGLQSAEWYSVYESKYVLNLLTRLAGLPAGSVRASAARELQNAADLDVAGRSPHQTLLLELSASTAGRRTVRSLILRGRTANESTAALAAFAVLAVLARRTPVGLHFAADVLDPMEVVDSLRQDDSFWLSDRLPGSLRAAAAMQEGAL
jgi:Saccharopine dehydrogenase NADP binding domain